MVSKNLCNPHQTTIEDLIFDQIDLPTGLVQYQKRTVP